MSEVIPEDVMKTARAVALEVRNAAYFDGHSDCPGIDWDNDNAAYDIARAILAERERCERLAKRGPYSIQTDVIASAIRDGLSAG